VEFTSTSCFVKDRLSHKVLLHGSLLNGMYQLHFSSTKHQIFLTYHCSAALWHERLVHCSPSVLHQLSKENKIDVNNSMVSLCSNCCRAKAQKLPFNKSVNVASAPLQIMHTDVWGLSPVLSHSGNRYYVTFTDEFSRFTWIYFCACKSDVSKLFALFKAKVELLLSTKIKIIQCDGGTEFKQIISQYLEISFHISCPYTPEQNGLEECKHRHIVELSLATIYHVSIPLIYWDLIFESVVFVINRLPILSASQSSPFQILFNQEPDYKFLRIMDVNVFPFYDHITTINFRLVLSHVCS
jgi:hypothetical protein